VNRRTFIQAAAATVASSWLGQRGAIGQQASRPRPSAPQLAWQRDELALFLHVGINTFTNREWGDGTERPALFNPTSLDVRQWSRTARDAGFKAMILTAKHHDGFCLWPTRTTKHSVASSPWRGGPGDLVREFVDACRADGLGAGLYLSPWDRNHPAYGDSPRYNDVYSDQLTELLTNYGPLVEVWFDGANGEGPNGRRQEYDWPRTFGLVRQLQPNAVIFSDAGPDVRWCGNESGFAGDPNWSAVDPAIVKVPGMSGPHIIRALQHGDPMGTVWRPAEADTSIRPGWFYHPAEDGKVKSVDRLMEIYVRSVGRNSKLLLNVPPTPAGLLHDTDLARLREFADRRRRLFEEDLAARQTVSWARTGPTARVAELELDRPRSVSATRLEESIDRGQSVGRYVLSGSTGGDWQVLSSGTTIGLARIDRFSPTMVRRVRLEIEEVVGLAGAVEIRLYP
jgi:alpha-L-fucosidase